jgi:citrate synthase
MATMDQKILDSKYSEITPELQNLADLCVSNGLIEPDLYEKYAVNRGLRDLNGNGVLTGLTEISEIKSFEFTESGDKIPIDGQLCFRGIDVEQLVSGFIDEGR